MIKESAGRQRQILGAPAELPIDVRIFVCVKRPGQTERTMRDRCLHALLDHLVAEQISDLVIDRDETVIAADRQLIVEHLARSGYRERLRYVHDKATADALLAVPDAIAWAWPQGGQWRTRCDKLVRQVQHL